MQIITYVDHGSFSDMGNNVVSKEVDNYRNSIVCGIRIKNSTNHKLECKHHYIYRGQIGYGPEGIGPKNTSGDVVYWFVWAYVSCFMELRIIFISTTTATPLVYSRRVT